MGQTRTHLDNRSWQEELERLQAAAGGDRVRWQRRKPRNSGERSDAPDRLIRMGEFFLAVSTEEGRLLYLLARTARARYVVEFGASYGVSTLFLGAAAADNGGRLVTTEVHPDKCRAIRKTLRKVELDPVVTLLEGDARETLPAQQPGIEMLFLDGWISQYLPLLSGVEPLLAPKALVVADNAFHEAAADYTDYMKTNRRWFSHRVGKMLVSVQTR
ncbi:MAG: methyltransferase [Proteobacteria bacterium]|nr:methyltransferase [Pseudomonadota bacterium]